MFHLTMSSSVKVRTRNGQNIGKTTQCRYKSVRGAHLAGSSVTKTAILLTFWCRNYFFLILTRPVYKMWIKQEPNTLELWNKLHFEEEKKRRVYTMFKIAHPIYKMWIIQESNMLELWKKLHFEEEKMESIYHV